MKKLLVFMLLLSFTLPTEAITIEELTSPQPPSQRLGTEDVPEKVFKIVDTQKDNETKARLEQNAEMIKEITYADLSLNKISKEIIAETEADQTQVLEDIKFLWVGAAQNSETVKFIIYKLSNPDEEKPNPNIVKKIIQPLATVGSMAGIGIGNPVAALSTIMGSTMLGQLSVDNKELNYRFSKVNDADMVVLIRKIEELQRKIVNYYFDYIGARKALIQADSIIVLNDSIAVLNDSLDLVQGQLDDCRKGKRNPTPARPTPTRPTPVKPTEPHNGNRTRIDMRDNSINNEQIVVQNDGGNGNDTEITLGNGTTNNGQIVVNNGGTVTITSNQAAIDSLRNAVDSLQMKNGNSFAGSSVVVIKKVKTYTRTR